MILSVSRRTDIPNYYSEWFVNRIKEGFLYVRNPMNAHQVSKINLSPQLVDCSRYCYANYSDKKVRENCALYDSKSPILCGKISDKDIITERKLKSFKVEQMSLFDIANE